MACKEMTETKVMH